MIQNILFMYHFLYYIFIEDKRTYRANISSYILNNYSITLSNTV